MAVGTFGDVLTNRAELDIKRARKGAKSARRNIVDTQERIRSGDLSTKLTKDEKGRDIEEKPSLLATGIVKAKQWAEKRRMEKVTKKPATLPEDPQVMRDTEEPISRQAIRRDDETQTK